MANFSITRHIVYTPMSRRCLEATAPTPLLSYSVTWNLMDTVQYPVNGSKKNSKVRYQYELLGWLAPESVCFTHAHPIQLHLASTLIIRL
jgi:hypothetical protein